MLSASGNRRPGERLMKTILPYVDRTVRHQQVDLTLSPLWRSRMTTAFSFAIEIFKVGVRRSVIDWGDTVMRERYMVDHSRKSEGYKGAHRNLTKERSILAAARYDSLCKRIIEQTDTCVPPLPSATFMAMHRARVSGPCSSSSTTSTGTFLLRAASTVTSA